MNRTSRKWLQRSRILFSSVIGVGMLVASMFPAQAASSFTPLNGTWIVSAEQDGKPGRGMAVDVQDGTLVMQVYNYRADGSATFHLAVGVLDGTRVVAPLISYKDGRYFGSGPRSGAEDSNAGNVEVNFTSASTATISFPGEAAVQLQRFQFENRPVQNIAGGTWAIALLDSTGTVVRSGHSSAEVDSSGVSKFISSFEDKSVAVTQCTFSQATQGFLCKGQSDAADKPIVNFHIAPVLDQISGTANIGPKQYRLVGKRIYSNEGTDLTGLSAYVSPVPSSGTWIVTGEKNGQPGRGMAIDVQTGTLVMQVYNYAPNGKATFHLAVAPYKDGQASGALKSYQGGRYFGSGPLSGSEASDAGEVFLQFTSPTKGFIRFPGEAAVTMERFQFGAQAPDLNSLLGTWSFYDSTNKEAAQAKLTKVEGGFASGGGLQCSFLDAAAALVRCTESFTITGRGTVYTKDYRFILDNGVGVGKALKAGEVVRPGQLPDDSTTSILTLIALRIEDRTGVKLGLGAPF